MLPVLNATDPYLYLSISQQGWVAKCQYVVHSINFRCYNSFSSLEKISIEIYLDYVCDSKVTGCWLIIGFAHEYWVLLLGRFSSGIGASLNYYTVPMYIGETADKTIRGPVGGLFETSLSMGIMAVYTAGIWLDRLTKSLVISSVSVAFLLCCWWIPNSPVYLVKNNRLQKRQNLLFEVSERIMWMNAWVK